MAKQINNTIRAPASPGNVADGIGGCSVCFSESTQKFSEQVLVEIAFEANMGMLESHSCAQTGVPAIGKFRRETWYSDTRVVREKSGDIFFAVNDDLLFGWCYQETAGDVAGRVEDAYRKILLTIEDAGYPALVRTWHYLPGIHRRKAGLSVYQEFCNGRLRVARSSGKERILCAATVIGTEASYCAFHFLAAKTAGRLVNNVRQTLPWDYPIYAESERPLFARAVIQPWQDNSTAFVSGTASIVGHESRSAGNLVGELREIQKNLEILERGMCSKSGQCSMRRRFLKVYLSNPANSEKACAYLAPFCKNQEALVMLKGDICRPELTVEIETLHC